MIELIAKSKEQERKAIFLDTASALKMNAEMVEKEIGVKPEIVDLTQVIGSHTGPGLIALFFIGKDGK